MRIKVKKCICFKVFSKGSNKVEFQGLVPFNFSTSDIDLSEVTKLFFKLRKIANENFDENYCFNYYRVNELINSVKVSTIYGLLNDNDKKEFKYGFVFNCHSEIDREIHNFIDKVLKDDNTAYLDVPYCELCFYLIDSINIDDDGKLQF